jgi:hypothetical protein
MASGASKVRTGAVIATGAILNVDSVGFRPQVVRIFGEDFDMAEWIEGMADDSAMKTVAAGTRTLETSDGITPRAAGFALGALADVNVNTELLRWVAFE